MASEAHAAEGHRTPRRSARLVLSIVGVAVLCGVGIFGLALWFLTYSWDWFAMGLLLLGAGAFLLFSPATGPEHA
jgi:hypothetical protein